jgi:hypothetical protein
VCMAATELCPFIVVSTIKVIGQEIRVGNCGVSVSFRVVPLYNVSSTELSYDST